MEETIQKPSRFKKLVVDSSALIQNIPVENYAEEIYTTRDVINEIRDKATKQRLSLKPYSFIFVEPSPSAYLKVRDAAQKIGDLTNLSVVDLKLLALAVHLALESGQELREVQSLKPGIVGTPDHHHKSGGKLIEEQKLPGWGDFESDNEDDEESNNNDNDWITPENLNADRQFVDEHANPTACATCDFSMQNVLVAMGLSVMARDGMLVKEVRSWALRCASCRSITHDMNKIFCPSCGQRNLKRVPYVIDHETGEKRYFLSKSKQPKCLNLRGTKYDAPKPKGGKHCTDHIVCEGQRVYFDRMSKKAMRRQNMLNEELDDANNPFTMKDVSSRGFFKGNSANKKSAIPTQFTAQQLRMNVGWGNNRKKKKGGNK